MRGEFSVMLTDGRHIIVPLSMFVSVSTIRHCGDAYSRNNGFWLLPGLFTLYEPGFSRTMTFSNMFPCPVGLPALFTVHSRSSSFESTTSTTFAIPTPTATDPPIVTAFFKVDTDFSSFSSFAFFVNFFHNFKINLLIIVLLYSLESFSCYWQRND